MIDAKTSRRTILKAGAALLTVGAGLRAGQPAALARDMTGREKELYEAAKKEGELTWYTAHSDDLTAQALGRDFESLFPGIKVQVVRTTLTLMP
jgi:iron(III) transport system substrate-binding protein